MITSAEWNWDGERWIACKPCSLYLKSREKAAIRSAPRLCIIDRRQGALEGDPRTFGGLAALEQPTVLRRGGKLITDRLDEAASMFWSITQGLAAGLAAGDAAKAERLLRNLAAVWT